VAIGDDDEARFFALKKFFDDDAIAGITKRAGTEHVCRSSLRLSKCLRNDDAFAGSESVRLDDDGRTLFANVFQRSW